jgi:hypothetical protein
MESVAATLLPHMIGNYPHIFFLLVIVVVGCRSQQITVQQPQLPAQLPAHRDFGFLGIPAWQALAAAAVGLWHLAQRAVNAMLPPTISAPPHSHSHGHMKCLSTTVCLTLRWKLDTAAGGHG